MSKKLIPLIEQYIYKENEVAIGIKIDYAKNTITLVEKDGKPKDYSFSNRGLEYMQGWKNILYVMNHAVQHAEKRLQAYEDGKAEDFAKLMFAAQESTEEENTQQVGTDNPLTNNQRKVS